MVVDEGVDLLDGIHDHEDPDEEAQSHQAVEEEVPQDVSIEPSHRCLRRVTGSGMPAVVMRIVR
jgi:hypothetical protein